MMTSLHVVVISLLAGWLCASGLFKIARPHAVLTALSPVVRRPRAALALTWTLAAVEICLGIALALRPTHTVWYLIGSLFLLFAAYLAALQPIRRTGSCGCGVELRALGPNDVSAALLRLAVGAAAVVYGRWGPVATQPRLRAAGVTLVTIALTISSLYRLGRRVAFAAQAGAAGHEPTAASPAALNPGMSRRHALRLVGGGAAVAALATVGVGARAAFADPICYKPGCCGVYYCIRDICFYEGCFNGTVWLICYAMCVSGTFCSSYMEDTCDPC